MTSNSLVLSQIRQCDADDNVKNALVEIFKNEVSMGTTSNVMQHKIKECRKIITKGVLREDF